MRQPVTAWAEAGVSPVDLFKAATVNNAVALGLIDEVGTVEPGKRADLVLLRDNPLDSVRAVMCSLTSSSFGSGGAQGDRISPP